MRKFLVVISFLVCAAQLVSGQFIGSGQLTINAGRDTVMPCNGNSIILRATGLGNMSTNNIFPRATTSYAVDTVSYRNQDTFNFNTGATNATLQLATRTDDGWFAPIQMPFSFCYYGNTYDSITPSVNGYVRVGRLLSTLNSPFQYTVAAAPSPGTPLPLYNATAGAYALNTVYGNYRDYDLNSGGSVRWKVFGTAPNRVMVVYYKDMQPSTSVGCTPTTNFKASFQIAFYETSNVIDVITMETSGCNTAADQYARAVCGIVNLTGTSALAMTTPTPGAPLGRNAEAYSLNSFTSGRHVRFYPTGATTGNFAWKETSGATLATTTTLTVAPPAITPFKDYVAEYTLVNCAGTATAVVRDTVRIRPSAITFGSTAVSGVSCARDSNARIVFDNISGGGNIVSATWLPASATTTTAGLYSDNTTINGDSVRIENLKVLTPASPLVPTNTIYTITVTDDGGCTATTAVTISQPAIYSISLPLAVNTIPCSSPVASYTVTANTGGISSCTFTAVSDPTHIVTQSGPTGVFISNVDTGTYFITAVSSAGCSATKSINVIYPNLPTWTLASKTNINDPLCGQLGAITMNRTSVAYTPPPPAGSYWFTYSINPNPIGSTFPANPSNPATSPTNMPYSVGTTPLNHTVVWDSLIAGTYTTTVQDSRGCSVSSVVTIDSFSKPTINSSPTLVMPLCAGVCNGSISASATSFATNAFVFTHTYNLYPPSGPAIPSNTSGNFTGLCAGIYTLVATNNKLCRDTLIINMIAPPSVAISLDSIDNVGCFGDSSGCIYFTASGGTKPYTYTINPNIGIGAIVDTNSGSFCNLPSGTYTVTTSDFNNCSTSVVYTVTNSNPAITLAPVVKNVSCFGGNNGYVIPNAAGGSSPITGNINGSGPTFNAITDTVNNLSSGTYTINVTDALGCSRQSTVVISQPTTPLSISITLQGNVLCKDSLTGSATVAGSGGTAPYSYSWSTGGTTDTVSGLAAGAYTATVTDANLCTSTIVVTITQPSLPVVVTVVANDTQICSGQNVTLTASGAATYTWNLLTPGNPRTTPALVSTTTYVVTGSDAFGCTASSSIIIGVDTLPNIIATATPPTLCVNGSTVITATGALSYVWNNGLNPLPSNTLTATVPGNSTFSVTGTDGNGCTSTAAITITVNALPVAAISASPSATICVGQTLTLTATGGTSYAWSAPLTATTNTVAVSPTANTIYTVTVTNAANCTSTTTILITVNPLPNVAVTANPNPICANQTSVLTGSGATSYTWSGGLTPGNPRTTPILTADTTYTVTGTDLNGCIATSSVTVSVNALPPVTVSAAPNPICATNSFTLNAGGATTYAWNNGLPAGTSNTVVASTLGNTTYVVTGTDGNGCTSTSSVTITVNALPAAVISASPSATICVGQTLTLTATGGTGYAWSAPLTATTNTVAVSPTANTIYTVIVTNAANCTSTTTILITVNPLPNVAVTANPNPICANQTSVLTGSGATSYAWSGGLTPGNPKTTPVLTADTTYTVTGTDLNGCIATSSVTVSVNALPPVTVSATPNPICLTNSFTLNAGGATTYTWNNGLPAGTSNTVVASTLGNTTYVVTGTDGNGCTSTSSVTITVNALPPAAISASPSATICVGQTLTLTATGGTGYAWSAPLTATTNTVAVSPIANTIYTVTVTNAANCTSTTTILITVNPLPNVTVSAAPNPICVGSSTTLTATGAVSYTWDNSLTPGNPKTVSPVTPTTYITTGTDANGCTNTASVVIVVDTLPIITVTASPNPICNNTLSTLTANGANTYAWSAPAGTGSTYTTPNITANTTYTVLGTDNNGCSSSATITITVPAPLVITIDSIRQNQCFGDATGAVFTTTSGGQGPYIYLWSNGAIIKDLQLVALGTYTLTSTDAIGCTSTISVTTIQPTVLTVSASVSNNVGCFGQSTGNALATISGGVGGGTTTWSSSTNPTYQLGASLTNAPAGSYTVTNVNANGCSSSSVVMINQPPDSVSVSFSNMVMPGCGTLQDSGKVSITALGGTPDAGGIYTYSLSGGTGTISSPSSVGVASGLSAGTYTFTATDANGCTETISLIFSVPNAPTVSVLVDSVNCFGGNDGSAVATVLGGTGAISYSWTCSPSVTNVANGLSAGSCTLTVTDAVLCQGNVVFVVGEPAVLSLSTTFTNATCNNVCDGSIDLSVSGGNTPYSYVWSNGAITEDISGLCDNTYTATVTDAYGCTSTISVTITEPTPIVPNASVVQNVSCFGGNDGSATAAATGGPVGPYSYSWSNGQTVATATSLIAGTYTVSVSVNGACTATQQIIVTQPTDSVSVSFSNMVMPGCGTLIDSGKVSITALGGTPGAGGIYTYSLSGGTGTISSPSTVGVAIGLSAGTYTFTATDANGCTETISLIFSVPNAPTVSVVVDSVNCFGGNDGSAVATVLGGTGAISYSWTCSPSVTNVANGLSAGSCTLTVTDAVLCQGNVVFVVGEPAVLSLSTTFTNATCNNVCDGSIDLSVSGGNTPYSYVWSNGAISEDISGLCDNTYTATVTDAYGCTSTISVTITEPTPIVPNASVVQNVSCFGGNDGSATAAATGGPVGPYSYSWSNGQNLATATGLVAGTYTVSVSVNGACTATQQIIVTQPTDSVSVSFSNMVMPGCGTLIDSGKVSITALGGTPGAGGIYTYSLSGGTGTISSPSTVGVAIGLSAGTYTFTATDANGCTETISLIFSVPNAPTVSVVVDSVNCFGGNDGSAVATVLGGTGAISYSWTCSPSVTNVANGLSAGSCTLTVTDAVLCQGNVVFVVGEPAVLSLSTTFTNATCNNVCDGSIDLSVSGGNTPYSYVWSNGAITEDISGLCDNTYTATVTDAYGCTSTISVTITEPTPIVPNASVVQNVSCFGGNDGSATAAATGGPVGPYSYSWSNGQTVATATSLIAGTYTVSVSVNGACTATQQIIVTQPTDSVSVSFSNMVMPGCGTLIDSGKVSITALGGTPGAGGIYTYSLSGGTGTISSPSTVGVAIGLSAGTYTFTATDANGCTETISLIFSVPNAPTVSVVVDSVNCFGGNDGSAVATVLGGTGAISYSWTCSPSVTNVANGLSAGSCTLTVTDAVLCQGNVVFVVGEPAVLSLSTTFTNATCNNVCDGSIDLSVSGGNTPYSYVWSNGAISEDISGLCDNTYTATVTDAYGCTSTISVTITEPTPIVPNASVVQNVSCFGGNDGSATAAATGGPVGPYSYSWSNGQNLATATGLVAGTYTVSVSVNGACTATQQIIVTQPTDSVSVSFSNMVMPGCGTLIDSGKVSITALGGTPGAGGIYTYSLSGGTGTISSPSTVGVAIGLSAGTYTFTATDANGCTETISLIFSVPNAPTVSVVVDSVNCFGGNDGSAVATVLGGTGAISYSWTCSPSVTNVANGLSAGSCTLTVTDAVLCQGNVVFVVGEPAVLSLSTTFTNATCNNVCDGSIDLSVSGGNTPYSYVWSNGAITEDISGLCDNTYTATVTDAYGCTSTISVTITEPTPIVPNASVVQNVSCFGGNDGSAAAAATGGPVGPYSYSWSNGQNLATATGLVAGTYTVSVSVNGACTATQQIIVTQPSNLPSITSAIIVTPPGCGALSNAGSATASVSGGTSNYTWSINPSAGITFAPNPSANTTINGLSAGSFTITATDANGCSTTTAINPVTANGPTVSITGVNTTCNNLCDGSASSIVTGGTPAYTYLWNTGAVTANITNLCPGTYTLTVTDANTCSASSTIQIIAPSAIVFVNTNLTAVNPTSSSASNGSITVNGITGGTPPYQYSIDGNPFVLSNVFNGLATGNYNICVKDNNNCDSVCLPITLVAPSVLTVLPNATNETCFGANDGIIVLNTGGSVGPYTYSGTPVLSGPNNSTATYANLVPGTYTYTITAANGDVVTTTATIVAATQMVATLNSTTTPNCSTTNGGANISVVGGSGLYNITLNPGAIVNNGVTSVSYTTLGAGSFNVTIVDAAHPGCSITTTFTLNNPTPPAFTSASTTPATCAPLPDGCINFVANVANPGLQLSINGSANVPVVSPYSACTFAAGNYTLVITDAKGCTANTTVTVLPPASISLDTLFTTASNCLPAPQGCIGTAQLQVTGGVAPFTYTNLTTGVVQNNNSLFTGLCAGITSFEVLDDKGCSATFTVNILVPNVPTVSVSNEISPLCFGDSNASIDFAVVSGSAYYITLGGAAVKANTTIVGNTITGLGCGLLTITATNNDSCIGSLNYNITCPTLLVLSGTSNQATINGVCNGSINATTVGGTGIVSYTLYNSTMSTIIAGPQAGTGTFTGLCGDSCYVVMATDANGCSKTTSLCVISAGQLVCQFTNINGVSCNAANSGNSSNGSASLNVTGGFGTKTMVVTSTNGYNQTFTAPSNLTGLAAGNYTVVTTDAAGASTTCSFVISAPNPIQITSMIPTHPGCNPAASGSINISAIDGTGGLTVNVAGPSNPPSSVPGVFGTLLAGSYNVTVTDGNGCSTTQSIALTLPALPTIDSTSITPESCNPNLNGTISIVASSVNGGLTYGLNANPTSTNATITGLADACYTVYVKDALGCTTSAINVCVTQRPNPVIDSVITTAATCLPQGCDATITVYATSAATLSYTLDAGVAQSANIFNNVCAANHNITVTDQYGCLSTSNIVTPTTPSPTITLVSSTPAGCNPDSNGSVTFATSATGTLVTIAPSLGTNGAITLSSGTITATGLAAGTIYTVVVTDFNTKCTTNTIISISTTPSVVINSIPVTPNKCFGDSTASVTFNTSIGNGLYQLTGQGSLTGLNFSGNNPTINNLPAGTFSATVIDSNGCTANATVNIIAPTQVVLSAPIITPITCNGDSNGAISVAASGGTPAYTYTLSYGSLSNTSGTFNNLPTGAYTVTVEDFNLCRTSIAGNIANVPLLTLNAPTLTHIDCNGNNNGSICITATGGNIGGYTYTTDQGNTYNTGCFDQLFAGTYIVTATDIKGCSSQSTITLTEPPSLNLVIDTILHPLCFNDLNGFFVVSGSGGVPPYTYSYNSGAFSTTKQWSGLGDGVYNVVVKDSNGCTNALNIVMTEPALLQYNLNVVNVLCNGSATGSIAPNITGGTPLYLTTVTLPNGGGTIPVVGNSISNLKAGTYTLQTTDSHGCTTASQVTITEPPPLVPVVDTLHNVSCNGLTDGYFCMQTPGGVPPYVFTLTNLAGGTPIAQSDSCFSNLGAGFYSMTIVDAQLCIAKLDTIIISEPAPLLITAGSLNVVHVLCFGDSTGSIALAANGGTQFSGPDKYNFTLTGPTSATTQTIVAGDAVTFNNLKNSAPGSYVVNVTDANGCSVNTAITITQNPQIIITNINFTQPRCFGESNGTTTITAVGGVPGLVYTLLPTNPIPQVSGVYTGLISQVYTAVVTDAKACSVSQSYLLTQPDLLRFNEFAITSENCAGNKDGTITVNAIGGNGFNRYFVAPGVRANTSGIFGDFGAGVYTVSVIDTLGCRADSVVNLTVTNAPLVLNSVKKDITNCLGFGNEGSITVNVSGGQGPFTYLWSTAPAQTTNTITNLVAGYYEVQVTDVNGCIGYDTIVLNSALCCDSVWFPNAFTPNNDGNNDIFKTVTGAGIEVLEFRISDRWGSIVYSARGNATGRYSGWDGTYKETGIPAAMDNYVYYFKYRCEANDKVYIVKGDLILMR